MDAPRQLFFLGIADIVLSCFEEVDHCTFILKAKRWLTFAIRWVDEIWFSVACFVSKNSVEVVVAKIRNSIIVQMEKKTEMIKNAYKIKGLHRNNWYADIFAGVVVS